MSWFFKLIGLSGQTQEVDAASNAARVTMYDSAGTAVDFDPLTNTQLRATPFAIKLPQIADAGNSSFRTVTEGAAQFVGTWMATRSIGVVRQLVVLVSNVASGLGGTFIFEYGEDGSTAVISESRAIDDFETVRDFDLINAGGYFRIKFTPSRALTGSEFVAINTTQRTQNDGQFVRLANQELEEANSAFGSIFSFNKAFDEFTGKSVNIRATAVDIENSSETILAATGAGDTFTGVINVLGQYKSISVFVASDVSGIMTIQFAKNVADFSDATLRSSITRTYNTGFGQAFIFIPTARFYRVVYQNVGIAQTKFRLETILHSAAVGSIYLPVNTPLNPSSLGQVAVAIPNDGAKTTYSASIASFSADNLATDIFTITGSASKLIRIISIYLSATQTTASTAVLSLIKRSTANTGGTSAAVPAIPHDSNNVAATATVLNYTANPTLGTTVGAIRARKQFVPSTATPSEGGFTEWSFGDRPGQAIVLRGITQVLAVNLGGVTLTGDNFSIAIEWTEE